MWFDPADLVLSARTTSRINTAYIHRFIGWLGQERGRGRLIDGTQLRLWGIQRRTSRLSRIRFFPNIAINSRRGRPGARWDEFGRDGDVIDAMNGEMTTDVFLDEGPDYQIARFGSDVQ